MLTDNSYRQAQGNESYAYEKYRWKQEHKDVFLNKFRENFQNFQQHFRNHEISTVDLLPDFICLFQNSAENMKCRRNNKTKVNQPEWWDRDCERAKKENYLFLRHFRQSNSQRSLAEYLTSKKQFKKIVNQKKVTLKRLKKQNLVNSRKCPKQKFFCTLSGPLIVNKMKQISARYLILFSSNGGKTANFSNI